MFVVILPLSLESAITPPVNEKVTHALSQLDKHLQTALLSPQERVILINKLEGYFAPPEKTTQSLKNSQAELIYSTVVKSYNDILGLKSLRSFEHENAAQRFAEQSIGKIILTTRKQSIKKKKNS